MNILAFDTSSTALSVAVLSEDQLLAETTINIKKSHSVNLMPTINFLMASVGFLPSDLDRIVVAEGPGSYTGLRMAVATAKTLAYALKIDLVGVSSLATLALSVQSSGLVIPLIDARRNNVYVGFYENGKAIAGDRHAHFETVLSQLENHHSLTFVGELAHFSDQIEGKFPEAKQMSVLPSAYEMGKLGQHLPPVEVHSFVPSYLKKVEAEENWLKNHEGSYTGDYIKRV